MMPSEAIRLQPNFAMNRQLTRQSTLGEISPRLLVENYAPAAVLIDRECQILYSVGPVGQYLNLPAGQPTHDLMALLPLELRPRLGAAIQSVFEDHLPVSLAGGNISRDGTLLCCGVDLLPLADRTEPLQLICFLATPPAAPAAASSSDSYQTGSGPAVLEQELHAVKADLQGAIRKFEFSNEAHRAINAEAVAANKECQDTIEELMSWKSGLETLAKETNELNGQLRGALEMQQSSTNILRNILHSIGVAILLLDPELRIRYFTPEIEPFFRLIASDVGRPLGDLNYLAADDLLESDCLDVLHVPTPVGREIEKSDGKRFLRHIMPYRRENGEVDGVIIIFSENTEARAILTAQAALNSGNLASLQGAGKLHHPGPTLPMLQGNHSAKMKGEAGEKLQQMIDQTAGTLAIMLNSLREIRQIDASQPDADDAPGKVFEQREDVTRRIATLTPRERQIMRMVVAGHPSKIIATDLGISQRTVENHRAAIMRKTESKSLPALARLAFASGLSNISEPLSDP
jgi:two-component system CheB/CheR fusion protein